MISTKGTDKSPDHSVKYTIHSTHTFEVREQIIEYWSY